MLICVVETCVKCKHIIFPSDLGDKMLRLATRQASSSTFFLGNCVGGDLLDFL
jgi:hypothetical protein